MNILFLVLAIALFIVLVLKNVPIVISTIVSSAPKNLQSFHAAALPRQREE